METEERSEEDARSGEAGAKREEPAEDEAGERIGSRAGVSDDRGGALLAGEEGENSEDEEEEEEGGVAAELCSGEKTADMEGRDEKAELWPGVWLGLAQAEEEEG
jgi:hypothetical protein